jgi:hypothetical protein
VLVAEASVSGSSSVVLESSVIVSVTEDVVLALASTANSSVVA